MTLIWSRIRPNLIKTWRRGNNHFCSDLSCYRCWADDVTRKGDQIERGWVKTKQAKPRFTQPCGNFSALLRSHKYARRLRTRGRLPSTDFPFCAEMAGLIAQVRLIGLTRSRINLEIVVDLVGRKIEFPRSSRTTLIYLIYYPQKLVSSTGHPLRSTVPPLHNLTLSSNLASAAFLLLHNKLLTRQGIV